MPVPLRTLRSFLPRAFALACAAALVLACAWPAACGAARSVVIVSLDGLRPDVALRADMPALRSLMARGSFTLYATTTDVAITLPSHTSMLTGVTPAKHAIHYNGDPGPGDRPEPAWPTLFEVAHAAGLSTAMSVGKSKFSVLAKPGTLDERFIPPRGEMADDSVVAATAAGWIATQPPRVLFVHLPALDRVGHASGWGSPEQIAAAATVDRALHQVLWALERSGRADSTLIIVSADHGGAGTTHGGLDPRSRLIPWIAAGPGVRRGFDLTLVPSLQVRTEDTFATACDWLGLALARPVDGRAVREIFEGASVAK